ncbi:RNA-directed DNA polymerase, eukaryota [Tanacetum coccineum]
MLWSYLNHMIDNWRGESILMGDFNEVRSKEERFGSIFNNHNAIAFDSFISLGGLVEVPLGKIVLLNVAIKSGNKMSKLDRFLISESLMGSCPNMTSITLDRYLSDHRPILLREVCYNYGPTPFRMFHYWFEWEGFDKFIVDTWSTTYITDNNVISKFMKKMRYLKGQIRMWVKDKKESACMKKSNLKRKFQFRKGLTQGGPFISVLWDGEERGKGGRALDCFYKASGLRLNLHKSKLIGIAVEDDLSLDCAASADSDTGCSTLKSPCLLSWITVAGSMSRLRDSSERYKCEKFTSTSF